MKKRMYIMLLTALLIVAFTACKEADTEKAGANTDMPLASIAPAQSYDAAAGSDVTVTISEAETPEKADASGGMYELPENLEGLFAVTECAVFGEVTEVKEYELNTVEGGTSRQSFFSGITFDVQKSYGGETDLAGDVINIRYEACAHRDFGSLYPRIEVGKKYFFFLCSTDRQYTDDAHEELVTMFPYTLQPTIESVVEQVGKGYNGAILNALSNGTYAPYDGTERPMKEYSKKYVEDIIKDNIDNMQGLTLIEYHLAKSGE